MGRRKQGKKLQAKGEVQQATEPSKFFTGNGYLTVACILFGCAVVPLLLLLPYLVPATDDFSYAVLARQASVAGGTWADIFAAALQQVQISYETWQGTYSSLFLFAFTSIVKSFASYKWEVLLMQCIFLGGIGLLTYQLLRSFRIMERKNALATALLAISFVILFIPGVGEGLLWRNSMVIYSLAIGIQCVTLVLLLRFYAVQSLAGKIGLLVPILLLLAYLGGSNYVTALCTCFGLLLFCGWLAWRKKPQLWWFAAMLAISVAALLVAVTAPGNIVRATNFQQNDPFSAIMLSFPGLFRLSMMLLKSTLLVPFMLLVLAAALPALRRTSFRFPCPLAVLGVSIAWMAAHFTPTLYAANSPFFELRVVNTYFVSFSFLFVLNAIYIAGWGIKHKWEDDFAPAYQRNIAITAISIFTLIFAVGFQPQANSYVSLLHDLATPAGRDFSRYVLQACEDISASPEMDVAIQPYTSVEPWAIHAQFLMEYASDWRNGAVANYYQKNSVSLL